MCINVYSQSARDFDPTKTGLISLNNENSDQELNFLFLFLNHVQYESNETPLSSSISGSFILKRERSHFCRIIKALHRDILFVLLFLRKVSKNK